jgi:tetratricopeptide (TPR) repeat protein
LGQRDDLGDAHATIARSAEHPSVQSVHAVLAAHLYDAADRSADAEAAYRRAFDARPGRGRAFDALLAMAAERSDVEATRALIAEVPGSTDLELAAAFEDSGMAAEAAAVLVGLLPAEGEEGPEHLPTLVRAERALGAAGDWHGVFDMLARRRSVTRQPEAREAIDAKRRWVLAEKLAETEEAWDFYRQLHEEAPDDAEVLESLARIAGARGETALAIQYLEGLASVAGDGEAAARYRRRIAEVHLQSDDPESRMQARASYQAALDHHPEDLESLAGLKALAEKDEDWRALVGVLAREATVVEGDEQVIRYQAIATTWEVHLEEPGVAMDAWRKVLDLRPADPEALLHLIALARDREDWASLVEFAQARLPQIDGSERTSLQSELGRVFFKKLYREDEAVRFLDAATSGDHPDPEAAELLERIYAARGQWDLVVEANLSRAQAAEGEARIELLLKAAQTRAETLHDRPGAAEIYGMVLEEQPDNAEALRFRGDWLYNSGDLEAAVDIFARMQESEDERDFDDFDVRIEVALYYFRFAEALRKLGRATEALTRFEQGLKLNPSHLPSLEAVGPLYMVEERWSDAGGVYRQILQLTGGQGDPIRLARTYVNLGRVELQQGNLDKAKKRFNKALDLRANDIKALQGIAAVLFARKEWNNLLNVYNNIIYHAQEPAEVVDAYLTKGYVLDARLELPDKAQQHYEKSLAFDPSQPKALVRLAELALRKQDWPEAASLADRGLALDMDDPAALAGLHLVRAVAHAACSDAEAAGAAFEQAVAADVTLTDKLGATLPEWARIHEVLRERLQARL